MPKIVDHDGRRRELVEATWRVIAREGLDRTTTREIAKEAGYSNGVLAHYFVDKDAILDMALTVALEESSARVEAVAADADGLAALRLVLLCGLPLDEVDRMAIRVAISFWDRPLAGNETRRRQFAAYRQWLATVRSILRAAIDAGEVADDLDIEITTTMLAAAVDGLAVKAVVYQRSFPRQRQLEIIDHLVGLLRVDRPGT